MPEATTVGPKSEKFTKSKYKRIARHIPCMIFKKFSETVKNFTKGQIVIWRDSLKRFQSSRVVDV